MGNKNGTIWQTYLMFNLSSIPQNAAITNATLSLKDETFLLTENTWVSVNSTAADWTPDSINWNNKPTPLLFQGSLWITKVNNWYSYNCTNSLKNASKQLSLCISLQTGESVEKADQYNNIPYKNDGVIFFYSNNSTAPPKLEVTYDTQTSVPELTPLMMLPMFLAILIIAAKLRQPKTPIHL